MYLSFYFKRLTTNMITSTLAIHVRRRIFVHINYSVIIFSTFRITVCIVISDHTYLSRLLLVVGYLQITIMADISHYYLITSLRTVISGRSRSWLDWTKNSMSCWAIYTYRPIIEGFCRLGWRKTKDFVYNLSPAAQKIIYSLSVALVSHGTGLTGDIKNVFTFIYCDVKLLQSSQLWCWIMSKRKLWMKNSRTIKVICCRIFQKYSR